MTSCQVARKVQQERLKYEEKNMTHHCLAVGLSGVLPINSALAISLLTIIWKKFCIFQQQASSWPFLSR